MNIRIRRIYGWMGRALLVLTLAMTAQGVRADDVPAEVERADSAYIAGDYNEAISQYKEAMITDGYTAELLYNLGSAYFKANDIGDAMICYERAHRLAPRNKTISNNLRYLQSKVEDANRAEARGKKVRVTADDESFFESLHKALAKDHTSNSWAILAAMSFILFIGALTLYIFARMVASARAYDNREECVLVAYKAELLTEPDSNSKPSSMPLTRGTKMLLVSEEIDATGKVTWYKVRLNSDYVGWVKAADIEIL